MPPRSVGEKLNLRWASALVLYLPPLQPIFHTAPLGLVDLAILAPFPLIVWGVDELWRARRRATQTSAAATAK